MRPVRVAVRILAKPDNDRTDDTVRINRAFGDYTGPMVQLGLILRYLLKIERT